MVDGGDPITRLGEGRYRGRLDGVDDFDGGFFGISPREARGIDPQQRVLLEVGHEALQDAGLAVAALAGSDTAVFAGQHSSDYAQMQHDAGVSGDIHSLIGSATRANTSGRLSFAFDLRGPSVTVDAACASSLVALHLAMRSLRAGECGLALVGGVNLVLLPAFDEAFTAVGITAADGRCKFGDARADGIVRSDGVAAVVLKPLAAARRDGDRVHAVLRGSSVVNDGRASGALATPAAAGQEAVLREAYRDAGVDPSDVDYVEAHGTGTPVGDSVELGALASVLVPGRPGDRPCVVGSSKATVGHTESAAGLVGLIRAVLCLRHGAVPPQHGLGELNPAVPWDGLALPRAGVRLPPRDRPRTAGVSSFGLSGTNAHVVLTAPDEPAPESRRATSTTGPVLLALSARCEPALDLLATDHRDLLAPGGGGRAVPLADLARAAATRRDHHEHRLAVVADSHDAAVAGLDDLLAGRGGAAVARGEGPAEAPPRLAFVFAGQGAQWIGMGRELLATEPAFAEALLRCDEAVRSQGGGSVVHCLTTAPGDRFTDLAVVQPVLWSMQVALAALWQSWGVSPDVVIGHSMGEVAAAAVSGALCLDDAASVICRRSRLVRRLRGLGGMVLTDLSPEDAAELADATGGGVVVAAVNGPRSTMLAGATVPLDDAVARLRATDAFVGRIDAGVASHTEQMRPLAGELRAALAGLRPRRGPVPMHSTVHAEPVDGSGLDAAYWVANLCEPVRFLDAVRAQPPGTVFLEVGPHPVLTGAVRDTLARDGAGGAALGPLRRERPERASMLAGLAQLYVRGVDVTGAAVAPPGPARHVDLPLYPWQHETLPRPGGGTEADVPEAPAVGAETDATTGHPLLGDPDPSGGWTWIGRLDLHDHPYLREHRVDGVPIVPGTAFVELLCTAAAQALGEPAALFDVAFDRALFLIGEAPAPRLRTDLRSLPDGSLRCSVSSSDADDAPWTEHVTAIARPAGDPPEPLRAGPPTATGEAIDGTAFYDAHAARGNHWGPSFRGVRTLWTDAGSSLGRVERPDGLGPWPGGLFHPAWLDACLHTAAAPHGPGPGPFVLGGIDEVRLGAPPSDGLWGRARAAGTDAPDSVASDLDVVDDGGVPVVQVRGLRLRYLADPPPGPASAAAPGPGSAAPGPAAPEPGGGLHVLRWAPAAPVAPAATTGDWVVLSDGSAVSCAVVSALRAGGARVHAVLPGAAFRTDGPGCYTAAPAAPGDLARVLAHIGRPVHGVLHLWALGAPADAWTERARDLVCGSVPPLVTALDAGGGAPPGLWFVTRGAQAVDPGDRVGSPFQAPLWGLVRALAGEEARLRPVLVDLDGDPASTAALVAELAAAGAEDQVALRRGRRFVARLLPAASPAPAAEAPGTAAPPAGTGSARLGVARPGDLDGLAMTAGPRPEPGPGQVRLRVTHAALTFQDVLLATGTLPEGAASTGMGKDCAGVVDALGPGTTGLAVGDEVVALATSTMATHVVTSAELVVRRPERLTAAEAATLPVAFVTALHALADLARTGVGDRVLVHAATGGVGLAAVQVAQWLGARVHGTAGSAEKRALLPVLGVVASADSRSLDFVEDLLEATGGHGMDVILNCLTGAAVPANLSLLAPHGRHVELGIRDFHDDVPLGLSALRGNVSFSSVDVVRMIEQDPARAGALLRRVVDLVDRGVLRALPHRVVPVADATGAFRTMAAARHTGRLVLDLTRAVPDAVATPERTAPPLREDATYLVTGGLGGLGREVARWLAHRGARHLLLTGREGLGAPGDPAGRRGVLPGREEAAAAVRELEAAGCRVEVAAADAADGTALARVLAARERAGLPAVRGALHLAGVLEHRPVREVGTGDLDRGLRAKVDGAWTLHRLLGAGTDFLVLFSSAAAVVGSPLLGVYAAGNAFLDALARHRRDQGLPATSVGWGFWDGPGMATAVGGPPHGVARFPVARGLDLLDTLLTGDGEPDGAGTVLMPVDWAAWAAAHPAAAAAPLLRELVPGEPVPGEPVPGGGPDPVPSRLVPQHPVSQHPVSPQPVPQPAVTQPAVTLHAEGPALVLAPAPPVVPLPRAVPPAERDAARGPLVAVPDLDRPAPATVSREDAARAAAAARAADAERAAEAARTAVAARATAPLAGARDGTPDRAAITAVVRAHAARVVGTDVERLPVDRALNRLGLDSLMAAELRAKIQESTGVRVPIGLMLGGASASAVAAAVADSLAAPDPGAPAPGRASAMA